MLYVWEWAIGAVLVLIYAQGRFNTPETNRSSTTTYRYYLGASLYFAVLGVLYTLLAGSPALIDLLIYGGEEGAMPDLSGPYLAALLLTVLLPNLPILSKLDASLRSWSWSVGNIPSEARDLARRIRLGHFSVPADNREAVRSELADFDDDDVRFDADGTLQAKWTKATHLLLRLDRWREARKYDAFLHKYGSEHERIKAEYQALKQRVGRCFQMPLDDEPDEIVASAVEECKRNLREKMDALDRKLTMLIARGVLRCELTEADRLARLTSMGFSDLASKTARLDANLVVGMGLGIFGVLLAAMVGLTSLLPSQDTTITHALFIATMVAITYAFAVVAAVQPKVVWRFANVRCTRSRPVVAYLFSGVAGAFLAFNVQFIFKFIAFGDYVKAFQDFRWSHPWLLLSFVGAATLAYLADDYVRSPEAEPTWARWAEALAAAVLFAGAGWIVHGWLGDIPGIPQERIPHALVVVPANGAIGFLLGAVVPHWYRKAPHGEEDEDHEAVVSGRPLAAEAG